jgi:hypothetical protein
MDLPAARVTDVVFGLPRLPVGVSGRGWTNEQFVEKMSMFPSNKKRKNFEYPGVVLALAR